MCLFILFCVLEMSKAIQSFSDSLPRYVSELDEEVKKVEKIVNLIKHDLAAEFKFFVEQVELDLQESKELIEKATENHKSRTHLMKYIPLVKSLFDYIGPIFACSLAMSKNLSIYSYILILIGVYFVLPVGFTVVFGRLPIGDTFLRAWNNEEGYVRHIYVMCPFMS